MKGATTTQPSVLLVDDDTSLLVTLSDFLKFEGYHVVTADSGEEALRRLEEIRPDLIILDMSMPGMGGVGFLKAISSSGGRLIAGVCLAAVPRKEATGASVYQLADWKGVLL